MAPSTPASQKVGRNLQHPSTTPAGPPPSYLTNKSTTPLGPPPPRSLFGSSYNTTNNTFPRPKVTPSRLNKGFSVPESSLLPGDEEEDEDEEDYGDELEDELDHDGMDGLEQENQLFEQLATNSPTSLKRSGNGRSGTGDQSDYGTIASAYAQDRSAQLPTNDDLVLKTEQLMAGLYERIQKVPVDAIDDTVAECAGQLDDLFARTTGPYVSREGAIGPESNDPSARAHHVASLLLQLHHPHASKPIPPPAPKPRLQPSTALVRRSDLVPEALPKALLDWLNVYHVPYPDDFDAIHLHQPSPSENESFWDVVYYLILRGKLNKAIRLLRDAGWQNAFTALDDGADEPGYEGQQLANVEEVVNRCIRLLEICPGQLSGDWDVAGYEWQLFRQRVRSTMRDLETFAEGSSANRDADPVRGANVFEESMRRSRDQNGFSISSASRRAESQVPWAIYENLKVIYNMLLGTKNEVLLPAQDWLEGSIYLTVWWDGEDSDDAAEAHSRAGGAALVQQHTRHHQRVRDVDVRPLAAYRKRLFDSFAAVIENQDDAIFTPDTMDPLQVGLACVLEGETESALLLLRSWDITLAEAIIEIAAMGGWLPNASQRSRGDTMMANLDSEDLLVLSYGPGKYSAKVNGIDRDNILSEYAGLLAQRDHFRSADGTVEREGWELSVGVLKRVEDENVAQQKIRETIDLIELTSEASVEKVLATCGEFGLAAQVRAIAERYADGLADVARQPTAYGSALIFYARANAAAKLKELLGLLVSMSLLHSAAVPSQAALDDNMASLLGKDRRALRELAKQDVEAAQLLSSNLAGYATVRKFYDLRDETADGAKHLAKRRSAATALIALIESAADCIRGGLYDPGIESIVAVETLLALLGECLPLLGRAERIFTRDQVFTLLRVVEDFSQVGGRVRGNADELLRASVAAYRGTLSPESSQMGGSWDMLASSVLGQGQQAEGNAVRRAWDWRKGLDGVGPADVDGTLVLQTLRFALAAEVSNAWAGRIRW